MLEVPSVIWRRTMHEKQNIHFLLFLWKPRYKPQKNKVFHPRIDGFLKLNIKVSKVHCTGFWKVSQETNGPVNAESSLVNTEKMTSLLVYDTRR